MLDILPRLALQKSRVHTELHGSVLPFWLNNSIDREYGGYFNCLDRDGTPYDTKKHLWLQGRQVWMLSRMARENLAQADIYTQSARIGAAFLRRYGRAPGNRVYFCLNRQGAPVSLQRKMFSECFYVMAMAEYARATGDITARAEAREMFASVIDYARHPELLGKPSFAGDTPTSSLAVPMILLNLIDEVADPGETTYDGLSRWCVERVKMHIRPELSLVLETVGDDGSVLDSPEGRLVNPGHAIEAGWFLLRYARKIGDEGLQRLALQMIDWSFDFGWDHEFGGLYYFLDAKGYSPLQLEWPMKLWWPHCEAMVAFAMAFEATREARYWKRYEQVADYSFSHFADKEFGEWFGYLDRQGKVSQRFKGGPYKGCFHVPRALLFCDQVLGSLLTAGAPV